MRKFRTLGDLLEFVEKHNLPKDTLLVVSGSDHSYRNPRVCLAEARVYPDGTISEDWDGADEDEKDDYKGQSVKALKLDA